MHKEPSVKRSHKTGVTAAVFILLLLIPAYYSDGIFEFKGFQASSHISDVLVDTLRPKTLSVADARKIVQASSQRIAELVRQRPVTNPYFTTLTDREKSEQERIDLEIAAIHRDRVNALEKVVLADNAGVQVVDPDRGIYRVPIADSQGRAHWLSGSLLPIWHLQQFNPSVFSLAEAIRSYPASAALPPGTHATGHLWLGGTSSQRVVHPYPNDIDFSEQLIVKAPDKNAAGEAMAAIIIEFVARTSKNPELEFLRLRIMPLPEHREEGTDYWWPLSRICDPSQKTALAQQLASTDGGRLNSDWRALVSGGRRFVMVGKYFSIHALNSTTGNPIFSTQLIGTEYQQAFFGAERPPVIRHQTLGAYASLMRRLALKEVNREKYLKATKRAFNYFRAIGDLEAMAEITRFFSRPEARIIQQSAILGAVSTALDPATPSRILPAALARDLLLKAAMVIDADLPIVAGTSPDHQLQVAEIIRAIAAGFRGRTSDPVGIVEPDAALAKRLDTLMEQTVKPVVRASLKDQVDTIYADYIQ
jgi:hypothetical protein